MPSRCSRLVIYVFSVRSGRGIDGCCDRAAAQDRPVVLLDLHGSRLHVPGVEDGRVVYRRQDASPNSSGGTTRKSWCCWERRDRPLAAGADTFRPSRDPRCRAHLSLDREARDGRRPTRTVDRLGPGVAFASAVAGAFDTHLDQTSRKCDCRAQRGGPSYRIVPVSRQAADGSLNLLVSADQRFRTSSRGSLPRLRSRFASHHLAAYRSSGCRVAGASGFRKDRRPAVASAIA